MTNNKLILFLTAFILAFCGCEQINPENSQDNTVDQPEGGNTENGLPVAGYPAGAFTVSSLNDEGITYMWDESVIPEITIHITEQE